MAQHAPESRAHPESPERRHVAVDGVEWAAWVAGSGATGTGERALGPVDAVRFAPAADGDGRPHREALIAHGRFSNLFDEELLALFHAATPIPEAPPPSKNGPRNGRRR